MKELGLIVGLVVMIVLVPVWLVQGNDFFLYRVFAPKYAAVQRQVFEETKSYNDGMAQELRSYQFEYVKASPEHKAALRSVILHKVAGYDEARLPADLRTFVAELKTVELNGSK